MGTNQEGDNNPADTKEGGGANSDAAELHPDAWERFEKAVDKVAKAPPQHRKAKRVHQGGSVKGKKSKESF